MIKLNTAGKKKNNGPKYVIGGTVAVIIMGIWVSMPLLNSASSASVAAGNPFSSKVSDISMLGSDIASEGSAPGSPLSGEMTNNPATSGEEMLSSLFQSGVEGDAPPLDASAEASAAPAGDFGPAGGPGSAGGGGGPSLGGGKLAPVSSMGGGGGGSLTAGGTHGKFFGSGADKAAFTPVNTGDLKKSAMSDSSGGSRSAMMLSITEKSTKLSLGTRNSEAASGGSATPFTGGSKGATTDDLRGGNEQASAVAGLSLGESAASLKKSDPNLSKSEVKIPEPKELAIPEDPDEKMKQMIMQILIGAITKSIFGVSIPLNPGGGSNSNSPVTHS